MRERTLVSIKPDAYNRGLTGEILARFERRGLVVDAIRVSRDHGRFIDNHYPRDEGWLAEVGGKTVDSYTALGMSTKEHLQTDDPAEIGRIVRAWLTEYLLSGPVVPMIISGNAAIGTVRKIVGNTLPSAAAPGTIRGDYSSDSPDQANMERRPVQNLVHASSDPEEAEREINLWFPDA